MEQKIKLLTFTSLYPDSVRIRHGIFVETRLRHLVNNGKVKSLVVAPVPWFPFKSSLFGEYAGNAQIPHTETRHNIKIEHPRYPLLPKIGMTIAPLLMAVFLYPELKKIVRQGYDFQLIDAHYFYPDGVAAVLLGQWLKKPVTITARGSDLNLISQYKLPRKMIRWAAQHASGLITVSRALKDILLDLGIPDSKVQVLRNGVDLNLFSPSGDREKLRSCLSIQGKAILSVGNLIELKGHHLIIEALTKCPDITLYIAGNGPDKSKLAALVEKLDLQNRVHFLGILEQTALKDYYGAVDALVLASSREGWANVLLESMACGTPVIATNVTGTPEVVTKPQAGLLIERTSLGIVEGIKRLFANYPDRSLVRKYAENYSWDETTHGQEMLFSSILDLET